MIHFPGGGCWFDCEFVIQITWQVKIFRLILDTCWVWSRFGEQCFLIWLHDDLVCILIVKPTSLITSRLQFLLDETLRFLGLFFEYRSKWRQLFLNWLHRVALLILVAHTIASQTTWLGIRVGVCIIISKLEENRWLLRSYDSLAKRNKRSVGNVGNLLLLFVRLLNWKINQRFLFDWEFVAFAAVKEALQIRKWSLLKAFSKWSQSKVTFRKQWTILVDFDFIEWLGGLLHNFSIILPRRSGLLGDLRSTQCLKVGRWTYWSVAVFLLIVGLLGFVALCCLCLGVLRSPRISIVYLIVLIPAHLSQAQMEILSIFMREDVISWLGGEGGCGIKDLFFSVLR